MIWLTQQMADLFVSSTDNIGLYLKNIHAAGELSEPANTEDYPAVQTIASGGVRGMSNITIPAPSFLSAAIESALLRLRKMPAEGNEGPDNG